MKLLLFCLGLFCILSDLHYLCNIFLNNVRVKWL